MLKIIQLKVWVTMEAGLKQCDSWRDNFLPTATGFNYSTHPDFRFSLRFMIYLPLKVVLQIICTVYAAEREREVSLFTE